MATKTTAPARYTSVIQDEPSSVIDAAQVWQALGVWTPARMGVTNRMYSTAEGNSYVQFDVHGDGGAKRRFLITVAPDDTYSVEVGRTITRRGPRWMEWVSIDVARGVYADVLAEVVERMYVKAYS